MITVNMHEAKTRLSKLVRSVEEKNEVVVLCRNGRPVAEIKTPSRPRQRSRLTPDPIMSQVVINYDPTEPLTEDDHPISEPQNPLVKSQESSRSNPLNRQVNI